MHVSVITLFPALYHPFIETSLVGRAVEQRTVSFSIANLFSYARTGERIDAPTFGHGAGMLLKPETVEHAIDAAEQERGAACKIFFSPHGQLLDQDLLTTLAHKLTNGLAGSIASSTASRIAPEGHLMLVPARYEGMDARVESHYADLIVSVGNFVLMGGDIPALMLLEGLLRLLPGVVGKRASVEQDSFSGALVDYPEYTGPAVWHGYEVPAVVRSGDHKQLYWWRLRQATERTLATHVQWLKTHQLTADETTVLNELLPAHYAILMHSQVKLPDKDEGTTSVTSLDIHDIARSAATYGLKGYFLVTPLEDQRQIAQTLLAFWQSEEGAAYNQQRQQALMLVAVVATIDEALCQIREREGGICPVLLATSARLSEYQEHAAPITYYDQQRVWCTKAPVVFVFGTGQGLSRSLLQRCSFMLPPVQGFVPFNHLSVRSAAAVVLDRWLGAVPKKYYSSPHTHTRLL